MTEDAQHAYDLISRGYLVLSPEQIIDMLADDNNRFLHPFLAGYTGLSRKPAMQARVQQRRWELRHDIPADLSPVDKGTRHEQAIAVDRAEALYAWALVLAGRPLPSALGAPA